MESEKAEMQCDWHHFSISGLTRCGWRGRWSGGDRASLCLKRADWADEEAAAGPPCGPVLRIVGVVWRCRPRLEVPPATGFDVEQDLREVRWSGGGGRGICAGV